MSLKELYSKAIDIDQAFKITDVTFCDHHLTNVVKMIASFLFLRPYMLYFDDSNVTRPLLFVTQIRMFLIFFVYKFPLDL